MHGARDRIFNESKDSGGMFLVIPSVVMKDPKLPISAQLLYGVIVWKCGENAYTWASNRMLGDTLQLSVKRVSALLSLLEARGHIESEIEYREGTKEVLHRYIYPIVKSSRGILSCRTDNPPLKNKDTPPPEHEGTSPHFQGNPPPENEEVICNNKIKNKNNLTPTPLGQGETAGAVPEDPPEPPGEEKRELTQEELFDAFWKVYPRKDKRQEAWKAWRKIKPSLELCRQMSAALKEQKKSKKWTKDGGQYIPLASTWLNGREWENEGIDHSQIQVRQDDTPGGWAPDPEVTS